MFNKVNSKGKKIFTFIFSKYFISSKIFNTKLKLKKTKATKAKFEIKTLIKYF